MTHQPDEKLEADDDGDEIVPRVSFEVTSFGSDPEVELLVKRLNRNDIIIPPFQRDYVWRLPEASKFIESLLLGLPVPGLFFATDAKRYSGRPQSRTAGDLAQYVEAFQQFAFRIENAIRKA